MPSQLRRAQPKKLTMHACLKRKRNCFFSLQESLCSVQTKWIKFKWKIRWNSFLSFAPQPCHVAVNRPRRVVSACVFYVFFPHIFQLMTESCWMMFHLKCQWSYQRWKSKMGTMCWAPESRWIAAAGPPPRQQLFPKLLMLVRVQCFSFPTVDWNQLAPQGQSPLPLKLQTSPAINKKKKKKKTPSAIIQCILVLLKIKASKKKKKKICSGIVTAWGFHVTDVFSCQQLVTWCMDYSWKVSCSLLCLEATLCPCMSPLLEHCLSFSKESCLKFAKSSLHPFEAESVFIFQLQLTKNWCHWWWLEFPCWNKRCRHKPKKLLKRSVLWSSFQPWLWFSSVEEGVSVRRRSKEGYRSCLQFSTQSPQKHRLLLRRRAFGKQKKEENSWCQGATCIHAPLWRACTSR